MLPKKTLTIILEMGCASLNAQSIVSGTVQDSITANPLFNVRVTIFNSDTSFFREARTDSNGDYSFQNIPSGTYSLGVAAVGKDYRQRTVNITSNTASNNFLLPDESQQGVWQTIVQAPEPLGGTDLGILLPNGKIFYCHDSKDPFLFDPLIDDTVGIKGDSVVQGCVAPLLLPDGKIIFVGGADRPSYGPGTRNVKTFNYMTETWTHLPDMLGYRWYPTMTRLTSGKLLVIGGGGQNNPVRLGTSELYNPATGVSYYVDTVAIPNELSPIVMLHNGKVLMTHRPPQLFDPATEQWTTCADFLQGPRMPNGDHADHELVLLQEGNVVAVGFKNFGTGVGKLIEKYNPVSDSWSYGVNFHPVRSRPKTVLLPNKKIVVLAGYKEESTNPAATNNWGYMKLTDLYDPYADSWRRLADMNYFREYHSLPILVPDGRIIMVGGEGQPGNEPPFSVIEAFTPPYLFRGVRPEIANLAQSDFQRGSQINFNVLKTDSVTAVILMSTPSITHFMNCGNNRFIELPFTQAGNIISAAIPTDTLLALDGYYHLFVMVDDIPSVSKIVRIASDNIAPPLNCDSFCVASITYDTVNANYLYVTIENNDTNFINYPIVQLIDSNGDTVANAQKIFEYYGQLEGTQQTYHIPTVLGSFPQNWNGQVLLEDGLFHTVCVIDFPCDSIPTSIRENESSYDFNVEFVPGGEKIIIRISQMDSEGAEIIVSNVSGQVVYREKEFSAVTSIPIKNWTEGIYLACVVHDGRKEVMKFSITR